MEKNEFPTREELKTYFETGKHPTQGQFSDLIDSLKHQKDILTHREMIILANTLATMDNGYIQYFIRDDGGEKFSLVVTQQDEEDQVISMKNTYGNEKRQYFLGNAPYAIKVKDFPTGKLGKNQYYKMQYKIDSDYSIFRFFGNNLPALSDKFEFGTLETSLFYFQLSKENLGLSIEMVNTSIKFINKTKEIIRYRPFSTNWSDRYRTEDMITDHYNIWDYLFFYYSADLRKIDQMIECKIYNADNDQLLMTNYLNALQNNKNVGGGSMIDKIRNVRIECDYYEITA